MIKKWTIPVFLLVIVGLGTAIYLAFDAWREEAARRTEFEAHVERARDLIEVSGEHSRARAYLRKALALFPEDAEAHLLLAVCEIKDGAYQDAIERLTDLASRIDGESVRASEIEIALGEAFLGRFKDTLGDSDFQMARASLTRALESPESKVRALFALGYLHFKRGGEVNARKSVEYWRELGQLAPESQEFKAIESLLPEGD